MGEGGGEGKPPAKPLDVRAFYWRRFARLAPLWYLGNLMMLPVYFCNYYWQPTTWWYWIGFGLAIPPLGLNAWTVICFPPAGHLWTMVNSCEPDSSQQGDAVGRRETMHRFSHFLAGLRSDETCKVGWGPETGPLAA